jgi:hypothetical protein
MLRCVEVRLWIEHRSACAQVASMACEGWVLKFCTVQQTLAHAPAFRPSSRSEQRCRERPQSGIDKTVLGRVFEHLLARYCLRHFDLDSTTSCPTFRERDFPTAPFSRPYDGVRRAGSPNKTQETRSGPENGTSRARFALC